MPESVTPADEQKTPGCRRGVSLSEDPPHPDFAVDKTRRIGKFPASCVMGLAEFRGRRESRPAR